MERVDLAVVGASFAGLSVARSAARRGLRTVVLERKPRLDAGIRTTGLFVAEAAEEFPLPPSLSRAIEGVCVGYRLSVTSTERESAGSTATPNDRSKTGVSDNVYRTLPRTRSQLFM